MIEYLFIALLLFSVSVSTGFLAGYLFGRAAERVNLERVLERFYGTHITIEQLERAESEDK